MSARRWLAPALALLTVCASAGLADAQCAMCRTFLTGSAEGRAMSTAFGHGILLMLVAPYLVMGAFVALFFRQRWQPALVRLVARVVRGH